MSEGIAAVTRLQGYTFELRVDEELAHQMRRFAGSCRFVFNRALRFEQEIFHLCGFRPGYADLSKEMARWKEEPETFLLEDASSQALQQSLKDLEDAWDRHFEWFISILTRREVAPPVHPSTSAAGIDMGVVRFATLSVRHIVRWSIHRAAQ